MALFISYHDKRNGFELLHGSQLVLDVSQPLMISLMYASPDTNMWCMLVELHACQSSCHFSEY